MISISRDTQFLGSALIIATLTFICLEVSQADESASPVVTEITTPATVPIIPEPAPALPGPVPFPVPQFRPLTPPGITLITLSSDKGVFNGALKNFALNLILSETGEVTGLYYYEQNDQRRRCLSRISKQNCRVDLNSLRADFVALEAKGGFDTISMKIDTDFSTLHGGRATLRYLNNAFGDEPTLDLQLELKHEGDTWVAYIQPNPEQPPQRFIALNLKTRYVPGMNLAVGIEEITPIFATP